MSDELSVAKPGINAIVPSTVEQVDAFAHRLIEGNYPMPQWIKQQKNPAATASTIILRGLSLGMEPFTALEAFYEIKGRMGLYSSAMAARVLASGKCVAWKVSVDAVKGAAGGVEDIVAVVKCQRKGMEPTEVRYAWTDAVKAGYTTQNQKYKSDPKAMLKARAIAIACRENFADVLRGMNYAAEELSDFVDADATVKEAPPAVGEAEQTSTRKRAPRKKEEPKPAEPEVQEAEFTPPAGAEPEGVEPEGTSEDLSGLFNA